MLARYTGCLDLQVRAAAGDDAMQDVATGICRLGVYSPSMAVRIDPQKNEPAALTRIGAVFEDARVLEVGCGDGRLTQLILGQARSVVAIDPEPGAPAEFRRTVSHPHVEFRSVGFEAFEPAGRRFDIVLFSWSL